MKRRLFQSPEFDAERAEREAAEAEYRRARSALGGTASRLDYEISGLPSSRASISGYSTEELRRLTETAKEFRKDIPIEEIERTQEAAKKAGYKGADTHDNISAIMEATDDEYRDALRDLIESQYDTIDVASEIIKKRDDDAYQEWLEKVEEEGEVSEEDFVEVWEDDGFEEIF